MRGQNVAKILDPKAQALFETTAEVLFGLAKAFEDVEQKSERAWRQRNHNMSQRKESGETQADKSQDLLPPGRERINQGQQFDEMQRQQKHPDGAVQNEEES